ncbi:MAG: DUF3570 domain-containing protein [Deltaproteobacteria bacterium]|nr:DUF3570 domain-containing protein [Deltaproteobacteria bacterium]
MPADRGFFAAALGLFWSATVSADGTLVSAPHGQAGTSLYADDLDTTVVTPHVSVGATLPASLAVQVGWKADVITSASVDVVTAATTRMTDLRNEVSASVSRENVLPDLDADLSYIFSRENDAESHIGQIGLRRELLDDNVVVGLRYGASYNRIGVLNEPFETWQMMWVHDADLSISRVLGPSAIAELVFSGMWNQGYQENPYRRVPVTMGPDLLGASWLPEDVPDRRLRGAATARLRATFWRRWVAGLSYRFYADDWDIVGHTEDAEIAVDLAKGLTLRLRERGIFQSGASFYRERYDEAYTRRTRDRRLSPHLAAMAGLGLEWKLGVLALRASADGIAWRFDEFTRPALSPTGKSELETLGWVSALVTQASAEVAW